MSTSLQEAAEGRPRWRSPERAQSLLSWQSLRCARLEALRMLCDFRQRVVRHPRNLVLRNCKTTEGHHRTCPRSFLISSSCSLVIFPLAYLSERILPTSSP